MTNKKNAKQDKWYSNKLNCVAVREYFKEYAVILEADVCQSDHFPELPELYLKLRGESGNEPQFAIRSPADIAQLLKYSQRGAVSKLEGLVVETYWTNPDLDGLLKGISINENLIHQ